LKKLKTGAKKWANRAHGASLKQNEVVGPNCLLHNLTVSQEGGREAHSERWNIV
jgi:hypothetical protein